MLSSPESIKSRKLLPLLSLKEEREEIVLSRSSKRCRDGGVAAFQRLELWPETVPKRGGKEQERKTLTSFSFCPRLLMPQPRARGPGRLGDNEERKQSVSGTSAFRGTQGEGGLYFMGQYGGAVLHSVGPKIILKYFLSCARPSTSC